MTGRNLLLALHITLVAGWLGANFVQLVLTPRFDKIGGPAGRAWTEATEFLGMRYYAVIGVLILLTGVGLVSLKSTPWEFGDGFVGVGIATVIIGAVMGGVAFAPQMKKRVAALDAGDPAAAKAALNKIYLFAVIDTLLVVLAVLAMVDKWKA